ncbi:MAG: GatB/YqeY domain-containing protein [Gammaproteobacteria bacterium]|jgi:uncharacterized protein YqeY|nr:GatB/YqeY domain-containing protein [Gammaproteobacteria bacterium]
MASDTRDRLNADIKTAMKAGDKTRLGTLRFISAALKQQEIDTRTDLDEAAVIGIITKMASQRRDSISQFDAAGRDDLASKEREELTVVEEYLPAPLSAEEIATFVDAAIAKLGATSIKDMGKVMNELRPQLTGRVDMAAVSTSIKQRLGG